MTRSGLLSPWLAALLLAAGCAAAERRSVLPRPRVSAGPAAPWEVLGASLQGRPVMATTFGDGPRRVYLIGGIHGDEAAGVQNAERIRLLLENELPEGVVVRWVRDANPDGTAAGMRENAHGVDLNRNWPASNFEPSESNGPEPLSEPEARALHRDLVAFEPDVVLVVHAARKGPYVNYDGPAVELARRAAAAAAELDPRWRVVAEMGYPTPGSLGTLVGIDWDVPILTIELLRDESADDVWPALRATIVATLEP